MFLNSVQRMLKYILHTSKAHYLVQCHTWKGQNRSFFFFKYFLHMNHRQKISVNICVTILIFMAVYEGSQNTCNPQKIFQCGPVLWSIHVTNEAQRWHSWNFSKWLLARAEKGHLALWAPDMLSHSSERYKYSASLRNKHTIQMAQVLYRK